MKLTYYGHSFFFIQMRKKIAIDPFISGNPLCPIGVDEIKPDLILVTHSHKDHLGDCVEIAKKTGAKVITNYELAQRLIKEGVQAIGMNIGGVADVGVRIKMVKAEHTCETGSVGFIISDDYSVYHAGDTWLFEEMKYIKCDVALLPIGGYYTLDVEDAIKAARLIKPKYLIPMHYNTFPVIRADPEKLKVLEKEGIKVVILKPGEEFSLL